MIEKIHNNRVDSDNGGHALYSVIIDLVQKLKLEIILLLMELAIYLFIIQMQKWWIYPLSMLVLLRNRYN